MRTICLWRRRKVLTSPRTQAQDSCEYIDLFAVVPRYTLKRFIERMEDIRVRTAGTTDRERRFPR